MTVALQLNSESVQSTFRAWQADQLSLDVQLAESLAALGAYQSHLDDWQRQLVREREELREIRQQIDNDRATADAGQSQALAEASRELNASRDKVAALTAMLLSRTEELRTLDNRRAEGALDLELARAREKELRADLDDQKQTFERERAQSAQEIQHLRKLLERQLDDVAPQESAHAAKPESVTEQNQLVSPRNPEELNENPVLGSIVEQFGKLRQQRAFDRHAFRRPR